MRKLLPVILFALACVGCREYQVADDPSLKLSFSCDTLSFDTVFTQQGSATLQIKVYNRNANALMIDHVGLRDGKAFVVNVDGEQQLTRLKNLQINGGDSLFVFVRVDIDPTASNSSVLVSDMLSFHLTSGVTQSVTLEAYGQDVKRLGKAGGCWYANDYTFTADKPYLLTDTVVIQGTLTMQAGATLYMHRGACLYALGNVQADGTLDKPILIRGDRMDRLFDSVPYLYASGSWNGIYLQSNQGGTTYNLSYMEILSGNVGLYCYSDQTSNLPMLRMDGCRIHNHSLYGLVLMHVDALVTNTIISNCASYCLYCSGGNHEFIHSTIASFYDSTNIRIHSTSKDGSGAVFIDNLSKEQPQTNTSFYNSIITGSKSNQLVVATPFDRYYPGSFIGNYLKTDTLAIPHAERNVYWQKNDTVFRNQSYFVYSDTTKKEQNYKYYDFRLDSLSPAIGIGDSLTAVPYPTDRLGISRALCKPDAGCYQHDEK